MPLSVRLDRDTQKTLEQLAKKLRISKSELVRRSLAKLATEEGSASRPFEAYNVISKSIPASGRGDLSTRSRELLTRKIRSRSGLD